jgi:hypothetical protein
MHLIPLSSRVRSFSDSAGVWLAAALFAGMLTSFAGCGGGRNAGRPDLDAMPMEEHYGSSHKAIIYEFRAKVKKRGAAAAKQEVDSLLEQLDGYENLKVNQAYKDTLKEIVEKLKALQGTAASASRDALNKAADEIGALADKLPGNADPNPAVE